MRLSDVFKEVLREKGISRIWPCTEMWKLSALVAEGKAVVCKAKNCKLSMDLDGVCGMKNAHACVIPASRCDEVIIDRRELLKRAENYPFVLVDCRYYGIHTEKELKRLRLLKNSLKKKEWTKYFCWIQMQKRSFPAMTGTIVTS